MENLNTEIDFNNYINDDIKCLNFNKVRYSIGEFTSKNITAYKSIRDFGSLGLTILGKLILPKFVSVPLTFVASYIAIDQFIINCMKYYKNCVMEDMQNNLLNANNDLAVAIEDSMSLDNTKSIAS